MNAKPLKIAALGFADEQNFRIMGMLMSAVDGNPERFALAAADDADLAFQNMSAGLPTPRARLISQYFGTLPLPPDAGRMAMTGALKAQTVQHMLELAEGALRHGSQREAVVVNTVDATAKIVVAKALALKALVVDDSLAVRTQVRDRKSVV